jgi:predicted nucleic acid-binding protein
LTLVDTNILIDIATRDPIWVTRSRAALEQRAGLGALLLLDVVFAELAAGFARVVDCSDFVDALGIEHASMSRPSLWLAGRAFREYRQRGGARTSVLPDFFIGAHASVLGVPLQTRDAGRYRTYFPDVELVTPA